MPTDYSHLKSCKCKFCKPPACPKCGSKYHAIGAMFEGEYQWIYQCSNGHQEKF